MSTKLSILDSIVQLLQFQPSGCTIPQISGISGRSKADVLLCINRNHEMLYTDKKGKILGFRDVVAEQRKIAYDQGRSYVVNEINYGAQKVYSTKSKLAEHLKESYICGGFGDSHTVQEILATIENAVKLESLGILPYTGVKVKTVHELWNES